MILISCMLSSVIKFKRLILDVRSSYNIRGVVITLIFVTHFINFYGYSIRLNIFYILFVIIILLICLEKTKEEQEVKHYWN